MEPQMDVMAMINMFSTSLTNQMATYMHTHTIKNQRPISVTKNAAQMKLPTINPIYAPKRVIAY